MLRATANSGRIILLGLSRVNITNLLAGHPVYVSGASLEMPQLTSITVFFGETEDEMEQQLRDLGYISPRTVVKDVRHGEP